MLKSTVLLTGMFVRLDLHHRKKEKLFVDDAPETALYLKSQKKTVDVGLF